MDPIVAASSTLAAALAIGLAAIGPGARDFGPRPFLVLVVPISQHDR